VFFLNESVLDSPGQLRDTLETTLDSLGSWAGFYRSSGLGGREEIEVRVVAGTDTVMVLDTLIVRQPGLQAMARSGADYVFTDQDSTTALQRHGNNNHFMTPDAAAAFLDLFAEVRGNLASQDRYWITEASLEMGGLLDIAASPWRRPHALHRWGIHVDVGFSSFPTESHRTVFEEECNRSGNSLRCVGEPLPPDTANHYHMTYLGGF
jgi:hypothetical protein